MTGARVAGLVLAAGTSSRMPGQPKQLLPYRGSTIVRATVEVASSAGLDPVFVVVGHEAAAVAAAIAGTCSRTVHNRDYRGGISVSLAAGIEVADDTGAEAVVVLLADEPDVDPDLVRRVIERWQGGNADAVRVRYLDRPGHPVLISRAGFAAACDRRPDPSLWDRLIERRLRMEEIAVERRGPTDIDDPDGYEAAMTRPAP